MFIKILYVSGISFFSALAILGFVSGYITPSHYGWLGFFGLILLPVLSVNLLLAITGWILKNKWRILPVGVLLLNTSYLATMFQLTIPKKIPENQKILKIISYNVNNFLTGGVKTLTPIASYMQKENVDIICLQETPKYDTTFVGAFSYMPYSYKSESGKKYLHQVIFSKYPLSNCQTILFPGSTNLSVCADINIDGKTVRIFSNHLQTTSVNVFKEKIKRSVGDIEDFNNNAFALTWRIESNSILRANQADMIRQLIDKSPYPVIVCGDFNDTPASYAYHHIKGNLIDGFKDCGNGFGYSFRELKRLFRIDYVFYSADFKGISYKSPDCPLSDHKPVVWKGYSLF